MNKEKLVRYQINPTKNWGPGSRPKNITQAEDAAAATITTSEDVSMGDQTGTAVGGEQEIQDLGLAVDPAEAVSTTTKRPLADSEEDRDGKKIKLNEDDEESALNM
jgi:hypothetical protein